MTDSRELPPGGIQDLIRSRSHDGRKAVIDDLRRERSDRSVALLVEVLNDQSWSLRELAVEALADTPSLAAPRLMALASSGLWYTRAAAIRGLGLMGHAPALPKLLGLLDDANTTVAAEARGALLELGKRGHAVAVTRAILSRGDEATPTFARLDRSDPDATRKLRILANRDEVAEPVRLWLTEGGADPDAMLERIAGEPDTAQGIAWDDIAGPVGD